MIRPFKMLCLFLTCSCEMYTGLSIATARVTDEECEGVPHHLLGILSPMESQNINYFRKLAKIKVV